MPALPRPTSRIDVLRQGVADLLARNTTWTLFRNLDLEIVFITIPCDHGQGLVVRRGGDILCTPPAR